MVGHARPQVIKNLRSIRKGFPKSVQVVHDQDLRFGPYRLDSGLGLLMRGDQPTALGPRAAALLQRLVERAGQPVSKEALIDAAWFGLVVEESNLTVQIAALRKVLGGAGGAAWIETLPRRGYRYAGPPVSLAP